MALNELAGADPAEIVEALPNMPAANAPSAPRPFSIVNDFSMSAFNPAAAEIKVERDISDLVAHDPAALANMPSFMLSQSDRARLDITKTSIAQENNSQIMMLEILRKANEHTDEEMIKNAIHNLELAQIQMHWREANHQIDDLLEQMQRQKQAVLNSQKSMYSRAVYLEKGVALVIDRKTGLMVYASNGQPLEGNAQIEAQKKRREQESYTGKTVPFYDQVVKSDKNTKDACKIIDKSTEDAKDAKNNHSDSGSAEDVKALEDTKKNLAEQKKEAEQKSAQAEVDKLARAGNTSIYGADTNKKAPDVTSHFSTVAPVDAVATGPATLLISPIPATATDTKEKDKNGINVTSHFSNAVTGVAVATGPLPQSNSAVLITEPKNNRAMSISDNA